MSSVSSHNLRRDLFIFGGTPSSKESLATWREAAEKLPLNIHLFERPGFGESPPQERSFETWRQFVEAYISEHKIKSFSIIGISGGGPHALTIGNHPACKKIILVSSAGRYDQFIESQTLCSDQALLFRTARSGNREAVLHLLKKLDLSKVHPSIFNFGIQPTVDELILIFQDWPFELDEISCEVVSLHGEADSTAPLIVNDDFAKHIKNFKLRVIPKGSHVFFKEPAHMREILTEATF